MLGEWHCAADLAAYFGCAPDDDDEPAEGAVEEVAVAPAAEPTKLLEAEEEAAELQRKLGARAVQEGRGARGPERAVSFEELPQEGRADRAAAVYGW